MFNRHKTEREIVELHSRLLEKASRDENAEKHAKLLGLDKLKRKPTQRRASNSPARYSNEQIVAAHRALFCKMKATTQKRTVTPEEIDAILAWVKKQTEPKKLSYKEREQLALQVAELEPDNELAQALARDIRRRRATAEVKTIGKLKKAYGAH